MQAVARDLAAAQSKLTAAGSELNDIRSQAALDSQQLTQARQKVSQLQSQLSSQSELDSEQLRDAQSKLERGKAELSEIRAELQAIQKAAQQAEVRHSWSAASVSDNH